jgi:hypothetical protein
MVAYNQLMVAYTQLFDSHRSGLTRSPLERWSCGTTFRGTKLPSGESPSGSEQRLSSKQHEGISHGDAG